MSECRSLVEASFGTFLASLAEERAVTELDAAAAKLSEAEALLEGHTDEDLAGYVTRLPGPRRDTPLLTPRWDPTPSGM